MSKKELRKEKEQLNSRFKSVCKEWHSINNKLIEGRKEIQKEEISLRNPMYIQGFKQAFQSGDSRNRTTVYNASLNLIEDYQKNLIKYGKACQKMHDLEQKIYVKRKQINDKNSYVKGSKTFKQLNYKEGFALEALKTSYKRFYPEQIAEVTRIISDIAYATNVDLNLYDAQYMSKSLKSLYSKSLYLNSFYSDEQKLGKVERRNGVSNHPNLSITEQVKPVGDTSSFPAKLSTRIEKASGNTGYVNQDNSQPVEQKQGKVKPQPAPRTCFNVIANDR